ncbi:MAG: D-alanyl-D-alanine carboxypeptidase [Clostridiales bacterium]|nr:D-alanyl-D-alanine carboxypeptidase [Clostridiales bacterium]
MKSCRARLFSLLLSLFLLTNVLPPAPALAAPGGSAVPEMKVAGTAAILMDADHQEVLYEQDAHAHRYPASITKVMTGLLTLEAIDRGELTLETPITASSTHQRDLSADGSSQNIKPGEVLTVEELLYCTLVASANEACNILAEAISGDLDTFIALMNRRAEELGMEDTRFTNTHGLHKEGHYTTAYDISLMVLEAMKYDTFRTIVAVQDHRIPATNLSAERYFYSTNALLSNWRYVGYTYRNAIGVKTGHTPEAGYCLASWAVKDDRNLVAVVLGCQREPNATGSEGFTYFSESKRLLEWGFQYFSRQSLIDTSVPLREVDVTLGREVDYVAVVPAHGLEATVPNDLDPALFRQEITLLSESVEAPVEKGRVMGQMTLTYEGKAYGTVDLVALDDVERSELLYRIALVQRFFGQAWVKAALAALAVLIAGLVLRRAFFRKNRRNRRYSGYAGSGGYGRRGSGRRSRRR